MSTGLAERKEKRSDNSSLIDASKIEQVRTLATVSRRVVGEIAAADDDITKTFVLAEGMRQLQNALTGPIMQDIMQLANSPLGFKTDRPPGSKDRDGKAMPEYSIGQVKPIIVQALVSGLRLTGNEFNILVGNMYVAKDGIKRLVREFPGLSRLHVEPPSVPKTFGGGALVECKATWVLNGEKQALDCTGDKAIPVRVNAGMGIDAIFGKAERKFYMRIWNQLVNCDGMTLQDEDETEQPFAEASGPSRDPSVKQVDAELVDDEPVAQGEAEQDEGEGTQETEGTEGTEEEEEVGSGEDVPLGSRDVPDDPLQVWQSYIAECESVDQCDEVKAQIAKSRLQDADKSELQKLLATKRKRIAGRKS